MTKILLLLKKIKVCRGWHNVINEGMLWKAYVENQVKNNKMWAGLAKRRGWSKFLFRGCQEGMILLVYFFFICTQFLSSFTEAVFSCFRNNPTFIQKALSPTVTSAICVPLSIPILKRSKKIGAAAATTFKRSTVHLKILKACTAYSMMMRKSSLAYETTL